MGCFEAEAFSGAVIEAVGDESDVLVGDVVESHLLGEELADEPVHVFISATLPGCVRMREVEIGSQFLGDTPHASAPHAHRAGHPRCLSYDARYADLLFEVVTRRYQSPNRPILLTTNKVFGEWNQVFPNATCVGTLVDRLLHRAEIVGLEGESYRLKEAKERTELKAKTRNSTARKKS